MPEKPSVSEQLMLAKSDPVNRLTWGYVIALAIIGLMSVGIHFTINRIVAEQDNVSTIVGKSAGQMGLAQRVALDATLYVHDRDHATHEALVKSVREMNDLHRLLIKSGLNDVREFSKAPETLVQVYFDPPYSLNDKIVNFLYRAQSLIDKKPQAVSPQDDDYRALMQQIDGTLGAALEAALSAYEGAVMYKISRLQSLQRIAIGVILLTLLFEALLIFRPLVSRVHEYAEELKRMTMTDLLTGIGNRRFFTMRGEQEIFRGRRQKQELCLALIDLDHFKAVNDTYGHKSGDILLQKFVETAKRCLRFEDIIARIGGEEFAVLLPNTSLDASMLVMERLREAVAETRYELDRKFVTQLTISIGVTRINLAHDDFDAALVLADIALYDAKRMGRNKVVAKDADTFFNDDPPSPNVVPMKPV